MPAQPVLGTVVCLHRRSICCIISAEEAPLTPLLSDRLLDTTLLAQAHNFYSSTTELSIFMVSKILKKIFGSRNDRMVKHMMKDVAKINALEAGVQALTNDELKARTEEFRQRLADGEQLNDLLFEAFATVREAGVRALNMRHFDTQLIGGMVLNQARLPRCAQVRERRWWRPSPAILMHCPARVFMWSR